MSKFGLVHSLETIAEAGEKKIEPLIKEAEKITLKIVEDAAADWIVTKLNAGNTTPVKDAAPAAAAAKDAPPAGAKRDTAQHAQHAAVTVTPTAGGAEPVSPNLGQAHDARQIVGFGSTGAAVRELQRDLGVAVDGIDGPQTTAALKAFQRAHGLEPDGLAGPQTWPVLRAEPSLHAGSQGAAVSRVQGQLGVPVDGIDGAQTTAAVKSFQKAHGLTVDGIVGIHTWEALDTAAKMAKAYGVPAVVPTAHATIASPTQPSTTTHIPPAVVPRHEPTPTPQGPGNTSPNGNVPMLVSAGRQAGELGKAVWDAAIGDDSKTIADPKAAPALRAVAAVDLVTNVVDLPKGAAEVAFKIGVKATLKGAAEAGLVGAGSAVLQAATRLGHPAATGAPESAHAPPAHAADPAGASPHVRYAGQDREMVNGYRQSGKIVSVHDGIVTQSTGRATAEYKLSELIAESRDPAGTAKMLVPGNNVVISVESHALQVASLDQHREHERTQGQAR
jgi:peptidoglycan hydrolase-like protein with peptidoglycan-binding domain